METRKIKETHEKIREILKSYGNEEYGDCIIDEICFTFGYATTTDVEDTIPISYALIKRTVGWSAFCDVTGSNHYAVNEWGDYPDNELFHIKESHAKELGFIK